MKPFIRTVAVALLLAIAAPALAVTATLFPSPRWQSITAAGVPCVGCKIYTYLTGTTTPATTYTDSAAGTPNANPVVLDSRGEADIWFDPSITYRIVLKTAVDVTLWTKDGITFGASGISFLQAGTGAVLRSIQDKERDVVSVKDFGIGAVDGTTSNQTGIAAAVAASAYNGRNLLFPATGSASGTPYYKLTAELSVPRYNGQVFQGQGRRASRLYQSTSAQYVIRVNHDWATGSTNGTQIRDLWLSGAAGAAGLQQIGMNRSDILFSRIDVPGQGIYNKDTLAVRLIGNEFDGNSYGFLNDGTGVNTGPNNYTWLGNYFNGATEKCISTYSAFAWAFIGNGVESCAKGGVEVTTAGAAILSAAGYYEENKNGVDVTFDNFWGTSASVRSVFHVANYHNGRLAGMTYNYAPIRIKFGEAHYYAYNFFNVGNRAFIFDPTAVITNSFFGPQGYSAAFDMSDPNTVYAGVPVDLLTNRSRINDPAVVPTDGQNLLSGTFPHAWTSTLGAGSTLTVASDQLNGQPTAALVRTTATAQLSRTVAVSATSNSRVRNRFVSFCIDAQVTDVAAKNLDLTMGDGTNTFARSYAIASADGQSRRCVSGRIASGTTTITLIVENTSNNMTSNIASESLFVGMDYDAAPQFAAAPNAFRHNLIGSTTWDPASVANGASTSTTVTVTGAAMGDYANCSFSNALSGLMMGAEVSAANTVTCRLNNNSGGAVDLASGTLRARVIPQ